MPGIVVDVVDLCERFHVSSCFIISMHVHDTHCQHHMVDSDARFPSLDAEPAGGVFKTGNRQIGPRLIQPSRPRFGL